MIDLFKLFTDRQFIKFLMAGGFAAVVNFGSRFYYSIYMSFGNAVVIAYVTGMITAFILNKLFVFKQSVHSTRKQFIYFTFVNILAVVQTYIISVGLALYLFPLVRFNLYPEAVAHACGVMVPVFTSFWGHKYLSFRKAEEVEAR